MERLRRYLITRFDDQRAVTRTGVVFEEKPTSRYRGEWRDSDKDSYAAMAS